MDIDRNKWADYSQRHPICTAIERTGVLTEPGKKENVSMYGIGDLYIIWIRSATIL